jgi:DNA-binding NarL/FixJ family response regulator
VDPSRPITLWIVEDDADFRQTVEHLLNTTPGLRCARAFESVEDALASAATDPSAPPDVVLLDINLPGMDGIEGVAALKARLPAARVVMLTIRDEPAMIGAALEAGASGYLLKSAGADQLVAAVHEAHAGGMLMPAPVARLVMERFRRHSPAAPDYGLTEREREVLAEMVRGRTQKQIGEALFISPSTVNKHVQRIYDKLHVNGGNAAVAKALRERLLDEG